MIPIEALRAVGATAARAVEVHDTLSAACALYDITTPERVAMFLAQIGHESGGFRYTTELWGPTTAQSRYEGRADLGNTQPGDGSKFRGHGFIQTTGRHNHARVRDRLRERLSIDVPDFEVEPEKLAELQWACLSAADYWDMRGLNALADAGNFELVTRRINGGLNGLADRRARWERVKEVLGSVETLTDFVSNDTILPAPILNPEQPMAPFIAAALPALIELVPKLAAMFGSGSATSQRNIEAAKIVVEAAKEAIGARNEQELVESLGADPAAGAAVKSAIEGVWYKLEEVGGGIQAARAANERMMAPDAPGFWFNPVFWISVMLLAMPFMLLVDLFYVHPEKYEDTLRTQIITAVMVTVGMVGAFWLGTSAGSQRKTELMSR